MSAPEGSEQERCFPVGDDGMAHDLGPLPAWRSLPPDAVAEASGRDPVLVLPLAAIEQHGPHLPLTTDLDIGMGILCDAFEALPADFPAWVLPARAVGASLEHESFEGTRSVDTETLIRWIVDVGRDVAGAGVRRLLLANSHGGNRYAMEEAALRLRAELGLLVVKASWFRFDRPTGIGLPEAEWRHGLHGGAIETAMMLYLCPDAVDRDAVADFTSFAAELEARLRRLGPEGQASFAWLAEDLNPAGVVGDARRATAETGARLVAHYGRALADVILDAREFPLERLGPGRDPRAPDGPPASGGGA